MPQYSLPDKSGRQKKDATAGPISSLIRLGLLGGAGIVGYRAFKTARNIPSNSPVNFASSSDVVDVFKDIIDPLTKYMTQEDISSILRTQLDRSGLGGVAIPSTIFSSSSEFTSFLTQYPQVHSRLKRFSSGLNAPFTINSSLTSLLSRSAISETGFESGILSDFNAQTLTRLGFGANEAEDIFMSMTALQQKFGPDYSMQITKFNVSAQDETLKKLSFRFYNPQAGFETYDIPLVRNGLIYPSDTNVPAAARQLNLLPLDTTKLNNGIATLDSNRSIPQVLARAYVETFENRQYIRPKNQLDLMMRAAIHDPEIRLRGLSNDVITKELFNREALYTRIDPRQGLIFGLNPGETVIPQPTAGAPGKFINKGIPADLSSFFPYAVSHSNPKQLLGYRDLVDLPDYLRPFVITDKLQKIAPNRLMTLQTGVIKKNIFDKLLATGKFSTIRNIEGDERLVAGNILNRVLAQDFHSYEVSSLSNESEKILSDIFTKMTGKAPTDINELAGAMPQINKFLSSNEAVIARGTRFGIDPNLGIIASGDYNPKKEILKQVSVIRSNDAVKFRFDVLQYSKIGKFVGDKSTAFSAGQKDIRAMGRLGMSIMGSGVNVDVASNAYLNLYNVIHRSGNKKYIKQLAEGMITAGMLKLKGLGPQNIETLRQINQYQYSKGMLSRNWGIQMLSTDVGNIEKAFGFSAETGFEFNPNLINPNKVHLATTDILEKLARSGDPRASQYLASLGITIDEAGTFSQNVERRVLKNQKNIITEGLNILGSEYNPYHLYEQLGAGVNAARLGFGREATLTTTILDNIKSWMDPSESEVIVNDLLSRTSGDYSIYKNLTSEIVGSRFAKGDIEFADFIANRQSYMTIDSAARKRVSVKLPVPAAGYKAIHIPTTLGRSGAYIDFDGEKHFADLEKSFNKIMSVSESIYNIRNARQAIPVNMAQALDDAIRSHEELYLNIINQMGDRIGRVSDSAIISTHSKIFGTKELGEIATNPQLKGALINKFGQENIDFLLKNPNMVIESAFAQGMEPVILSKHPNYRGSTIGAMAINTGDLLQTYNKYTKTPISPSSNKDTLGLSSLLKKALITDEDEDAIHAMFIRGQASADILKKHIINSESELNKAILRSQSFSQNIKPRVDRIMPEYFDEATGTMTEDFVRMMSAQHGLAFRDIGPLHNTMKLAAMAADRLSSPYGKEIASGLTQLLQETALKAGHQTDVEQLRKNVSGLISAFRSAGYGSGLTREQHFANIKTALSNVFQANPAGKQLTESLDKAGIEFIDSLSETFKNYGYVNRGFKTIDELVSVAKQGAGTPFMGQVLADAIKSSAPDLGPGLIDNLSGAVRKSVKESTKSLTSKHWLGISAGLLLASTMMGPKQRRVDAVESSENPINQSKPLEAGRRQPARPTLALPNFGQKIDITSKIRHTKLGEFISNIQSGISHIRIHDNVNKIRAEEINRMVQESKSNRWNRENN